MSLTDAKVRNAKAAPKPTKVSDGGGLNLMITPGGSKLWRLAYRFAGKQKTLAIGVYPAISLEKAREARKEAKRLLAEGIDPGDRKREEKIRAQTNAENTFAAIGNEYLLKPEREGRAPVTRPGELRAAEWSEFDLDAGIWTIPAARTKMRREHRVPLPAQAVAILRDLKELNLNEVLVFPSVRSSRRCMSENTLNAALRRLGYGKDEVTSHGFRATASTLLNESGKWAPDVIERQLGHIEANDVRRAYARGEHWDDRVAMMKWWAGFLDELRANGEAISFPEMASAKR